MRGTKITEAVTPGRFRLGVTLEPASQLASIQIKLRESRTGSSLSSPPDSSNWGICKTRVQIILSNPPLGLIAPSELESCIGLT